MTTKQILSLLPNIAGVWVDELPTKQGIYTVKNEIGSICKEIFFPDIEHSVKYWQNKKFSYLNTSSELIQSLEKVFLVLEQGESDDSFAAVKYAHEYENFYLTNVTAKHAYLAARQSLRPTISHLQSEIDKRDELLKEMQMEIREKSLALYLLTKAFKDSEKTDKQQKEFEKANIVIDKYFKPTDILR